MIVVIADDFTGASEIGGIGLKFGLSVEIFTKWPVECNTELVIFDTNTRSKSVEEAKKKSLELITYIKSLNPEWIFKKIDSALRGHILEEINTIIDFLKLKSAVVIPANPKLGRLISDGIYYINEIPINETSFANDPEYTLNSSLVGEILSKQKKYTKLHYRKSDELNDETGILVGEVKNDGDMKTWASIDYTNKLPVGSAGFFEAILKTKGFIEEIHPKRKEIKDKGKRIIICGSAYQESRDFVKNAQLKGFPVSYMSDSIFNSQEINDAELDRWKEEIIGMLTEFNEVMIAIGQPVIRDNGTAVLLKRKISRLVQKVNEEGIITEFFIEGGATASEIMELLEFSSLIPVYQYNQGVIRLKIKNQENVSIVLKPGSYEWPEEVLTIKGEKTKNENITGN